MKCLRNSCISPLACQGFGYCRQSSFSTAQLAQQVQDARRKWEESRAQTDAQRYAGANLTERLF